MDTGEAVRRWMPDWARPQPYLSVIIPALNEATHIEETILDARSPDAELVVVDGGSGDRTAERAEQAGAVVLKGPKGRALQQNLGAAAARGSILLFLHADTLLPKDYVTQVFETLMDRGIALGAFRFKADLDRPLMRVIECLTNFRARHLRLPYGDQALFVRKSLFVAAGGFPEMPIAEDLFFVRLVSKQGRIAIAPAHAVTSGRRWKEVGLLRTTLINQLILAGFALGISPMASAIHFKKVNCYRFFCFPQGVYWWCLFLFKRNTNGSDIAQSVGGRNYSDPSWGKGGVGNGTGTDLHSNEKPLGQ